MVAGAVPGGPTRCASWRRRSGSDGRPFEGMPGGRCPEQVAEIDAATARSARDQAGSHPHHDGNRNGLLRREIWHQARDAGDLPGQGPRGVAGPLRASDRSCAKLRRDQFDASRAARREFVAVHWGHLRRGNPTERPRGLRSGLWRWTLGRHSPTPNRSNQGRLSQKTAQRIVFKRVPARCQDMAAPAGARTYCLGHQRRHRHQRCRQEHSPRKSRRPIRPRHPRNRMALVYRAPRRRRYSSSC